MKSLRVWGNVMADIVLVCVRDDIERAEALAEMFDDFGFSISDTADDEAMAACGVCVAIWSDAAAASPVFMDVARRAMTDGKGVVATFCAAPPPIGAVRVFDLSAWDNDPDNPALDPLFFALDRLVIAARGKAMPEPTVKADDDVAVLPMVPPRVAPPAVRAMALSSVVIAGALLAGLMVGRPHEAPQLAHAVVLNVPSDESATRVGLAEAASVETYDLSVTPVEDAPVGRRGLEPPSASAVVRVSRTPAPVRSWDRPARLEHVPAAFSVEAPAPAPEPHKPHAKPDVAA